MSSTDPIADPNPGLLAACRADLPNWRIVRALLLFFIIPSVAVGAKLLWFGESELTSSLRSLQLYFHYQQDLIFYLIIPLLLLASYFAPNVSKHWTFAYEVNPGRVNLYCCLASIMIVVVGAILPLHGYPLSLDEFSTNFQAEIFVNGEIAAQVPEQWRPYERALFHNWFIRFTPDGDYWFGAYRPINALIRSVFLFFGFPELMNALAAGGTIFLSGKIAKRLWPELPQMQTITILLMFASTQMLVMAMTSYAMPMHLFLNVLWLFLFMRGNLRGHFLAALVSVLAIGLHQIHYHPIFIFPFIVWLLFAKQWRAFLIYAVICSIAFFGFDQWHAISNYLLTNDAETGLAGTIEKYARVVSKDTGDSFGFFIMSAISNLARLQTWQHVAMIPLVAIGIVSWARLPVLIKIMVVGLAITLTVRFTMSPTPIHGWGYRYLQSSIISFVFLAAAGWHELQLKIRSEALKRRLINAFWLSTALSIFVVLPIRLLQSEAFLRPYAVASHYLSSLDADVVILDVHTIYFGEGLVRNSPWLNNRPIIVDRSRLKESDAAEIRSKFETIDIGFEEVRPFGLRDFKIRDQVE